MHLKSLRVSLLKWDILEKDLGLVLNHKLNRQQWEKNWKNTENLGYISPCNVLMLISDWAAAGFQGLCLILDASLLKGLKKLKEEQEQWKSLENLTCEKRLMKLGLFNLGKRGRVMVFHDVKGCCREKHHQLFSRSTGGRTRNNQLNLQKKKM